MFVKDKSSQIAYLVDTGADISVFPANNLPQRKPDDFLLYAANNSTIKTYGFITLDLDFGLRRKFQWKFIVANVSKPIIGADFLSHFKLLPDLTNGRLLDSITGLSETGSFATSDQTSIKLISGDTQIHQLLREFPEISQPTLHTNTKPHNVVHHIITTPGSPVHAKPRRLHPEKLKQAKREF